ncbi:MAG: YcxB family protein [Hyphomicrobiaceae bacterium]
MGAPLFDVSYRLTPDDFTAMMNSSWRLTPARRWRLRAIQAFTMLGGAFALAVGVYWTDWLAIGLGALSLTAPLLAPMINRWAYGRIFERQRLGSGDVRMQADEAAISLFGPISDTRFPWASVQSVDETREHVILWIHRYLAVPIPAAAFGSPAEAARFAAFAKARLASVVAV